MRETILNKLKEEHRQIQILLMQIEHCQDSHQRKDLFAELKNEIFPHMEGEELTLYDKLKSDMFDDAAEEIAAQATKEHQEIREMIQKLDRLYIEGHEWPQLFLTLKESILKHIKEEESELFLEAKEDFTYQELIKIARDFEATKNQSHY